LGRIDALWLDEERALVSWMTNPDGKTSRLVARIIDRQGQAGEVSTLGSLSGGRDSGVPQMVSEGDHLYLAWTRPEPAFGIELGRIPLDRMR
jgi:hypothetical protein